MQFLEDKAPRTKVFKLSTLTTRVPAGLGQLHGDLELVEVAVEEGDQTHVLDRRPPVQVETERVHCKQSHLIGTAGLPSILMPRKKSTWI